MFSSVLVYLTLLITMLFFNAISLYQTSDKHNGVENRISNVPILAILVFAVVFGIRYNVGIDHLRYIEAYKTLQITGNDYKGTELGFLWIGKIFAGLDLHYAWYFTFLAFLQLFLLFYAFRHHYKVIGWIIVTFILSTTFLNFMNVIRQSLAFCFECVALYYLSNRKYVKCYILIVLSILFHVSAVILIPLPLLYIKKENYCKNVRMQIFLYSLMLVVAVLFRPAVYIFVVLMDFLELLGYHGYKYLFLSGDLTFFELRRELGLGFVLLVLMNLINIFQSNRVKKYFNSHFLDIIYDLYFVGLIYYCLSFGSLIMGRINIYFYNFSFIISAFTIYYLIKNCNNRMNVLWVILLLVIYLGVFSSVIILRAKESCAIYNTCFS